MEQSAGQGIGELLSALEADAEEELARLDAEVERKAGAIVDDARAATPLLEQEPARAQAGALEAEVRRRVSAARVDAARALRDAREQGVQEAFAALGAHLATLRSEHGYAELFRALVGEALAALPQGARLLVDPRDEQLAREAIAGAGAALDIEPSLVSWGGVVLESDDGRAVRNTLEERLANAEPVLRMELARSAAGPAGEGA